jgi:mercuric reductase
LTPNIIKESSNGRLLRRHERKEERSLRSGRDRGGSAGFSAAIAAAEQGAQVALIGSGTIGGTCVNVGCVPSKTLIRAAATLHNARAAARFAGITAQAEATDWRATVRQKDALVRELRQAKYADLLPTYNEISYRYREGAARLGDGWVDVDGGGLIIASKIIIATGARPAVPAIHGIEGVPTSRARPHWSFRSYQSRCS